MVEGSLRRIAVLGASGLTGLVIIKTLSKQYPDDSIIPIGRRIMGEWARLANVRPIVVPNMEVCDDSVLDGIDVIISTFGTTRRKAGNARRFVEIDSVIPRLWIGRAKEVGCSTVVLMSSIGANTRGPGLYLQTKYDLEEAVLKMQFQNTLILRPSLLLGQRSELRFFEGLAQYILKRVLRLIPKRYRPVNPQAIAEVISEFLSVSNRGLLVVENQDLNIGRI
jgi:nucleoside-diphosphate-sugar epimerase